MKCYELMVLVCCIGMCRVCLADLCDDAMSWRRSFVEIQKSYVATTNGDYCARTVSNGIGRIQFESKRKDDSLRRVRILRSDGGMTAYEYLGDGLKSSFVSGTNVADGVLTLFSLSPRDTNGIDKMEFNVHGGQVAGLPVCYTAKGEIVQANIGKSASPRDVECVPPKGVQIEIKPYIWSVVGDCGEQVLTRNGRVVLRGDLCIGGKYPWVVGMGADVSALDNDGNNAAILEGEVDVAMCVFVLDLRNDTLTFRPFDAMRTDPEIISILHDGVSCKSFWRYAMSSKAENYRKELIKALTSPAE